MQSSTRMGSPLQCGFPIPAWYLGFLWQDSLMLCFVIHGLGLPCARLPHAVFCDPFVVHLFPPSCALFSVKSWCLHQERSSILTLPYFSVPIAHTHLVTLVVLIAHYLLTSFAVIWVIALLLHSWCSQHASYPQIPTNPRQYVRPVGEAPVTPLRHVE